MHPTILLLGVLALAFALPPLPLPDLAVLALLLLGVHAALGRDSLRRLAHAAVRLRWLLIAIAVLYLGFTPGEPLIDALPGLTREGATEGLRRALVLLVLLAAVQAVLFTTAPAQIASSLFTLTAPLAPFGFDRRRFALRFALALDGVAQVQRVLPAMPSTRSASLVEVAAAALMEIERRAASREADVQIAMLPRVPWWQWPLPPALALLLFWLGRQ